MKQLIAKAFNSGFEFTRPSYNAISVASNGKIYYVLSSASIDTGAQLYCFDPKTSEISHMADLTCAIGERSLRAIPQGKSHVRFTEANGKLYFATHVSYYRSEDGLEALGVPPPEYAAYPGGHFLALDLSTHCIEDIILPVSGQGILAMAMDVCRNRLYGITWPNGVFVAYDIDSGRLSTAPVSGKGEAGRAADYRVVCRALVVSPEDGTVYLTLSDGRIVRYHHDRDALEVVRGDTMRKDYFGSYDPTSPWNMAYHWRQAIWHPAEKVVYGVHGNSGYLFRFDPVAERVDVLLRMSSTPSRQSGMYDKFSHGYLGFDLGPDQRTLYYLTGGAIYEEGRPLLQREKRIGAQGRENLHLITVDLPTETYHDWGTISLDVGGLPAFVQSIAIANDGFIYALSTIKENNNERTDLIRIPSSHEAPTTLSST